MAARLALAYTACGGHGHGRTRSDCTRPLARRSFTNCRSRARPCSIGCASARATKRVRCCRFVASAGRGSLHRKATFSPCTWPPVHLHSMTSQEHLTQIGERRMGSEALERSSGSGARSSSPMTTSTAAACPVPARNKCAVESKWAHQHRCGARECSCKSPCGGALHRPRPAGARNAMRSVCEARDNAPLALRVGVPSSAYGSEAITTRGCHGRARLHTR